MKPTKKMRKDFPRLLGGQYRLISRKTKRYNCIAWAAGRNDVWFQAPPEGYWPPGIPTDGTVEAVVALYESLGYACTDDRGLESGVEKVAVYGVRGSIGNSTEFTHAARQLPDGRWTSKLGKGRDIEHDTLENLTGGRYGTVVQIMRRIVKKPEQETDDKTVHPEGFSP